MTLIFKAKYKSIEKIGSSAGYILLETIVSTVILSIGLLTIHSAMQQTIMLRAQAQDIDHAEYLLKRLITEIEMRPLLEISNVRYQEVGSKLFPEFDMSDSEEFLRFKWRYSIEKDTKLPEIEEFKLRGKEIERLSRKYLLRITVSVQWTRNNQIFEESLITYFNENRLIQEEKR